jgi:glycosyltransferase involved in cell wall biosynthesis
MRHSALVTVPSRWFEPLSTVIIESLANGRPVLGTTLGGSPYLIGAAGWVVEPTAAALADALPGAVRAAPELSEAARQRYVENFRPDVVIQQLLDIYASVAR